MSSNNGFHFEAPTHKVCGDSFYLETYNDYIWYFGTSDCKSHPVRQKSRTLSTFTIFLEIFGNVSKIGFQTIILKQVGHKTPKTPYQVALK